MKSRIPHKKLANGNATKPSATGKLPAKGSTRQRLHPGLLSSQDRAVSHYGAVTGLKVTGDGMYLLSAGWFLSTLSNPIKYSLIVLYSCLFLELIVYKKA